MAIEPFVWLVQPGLDLCAEHLGSEIQQVLRRTSQPGLVLRPRQMRSHIDPEGTEWCRGGHQALVEIVDALMVVAVGHQLDAELLGELVDHLPAMRVSRRRLVRRQDVGGAAAQQLLVVGREDTDVPGGRYIDRPVYVLTSKNTFSGGKQ